jgi:hypothetical protein
MRLGANEDVFAFDRTSAEQIQDLLELRTVVPDRPSLELFEEISVLWLQLVERHLCTSLTCVLGNDQSVSRY